MPKHALIIYSDPEFSEGQSKVLADSLIDGVGRRGWTTSLLPVTEDDTYETVEARAEDLIASNPDIEPGSIVLLHGTSAPAVVEALSAVSRILARLQHEYGTTTDRFQFMHYTIFTRITPEQWEALATAETFAAGINSVLKGVGVEEERFTDTAEADASEVENDGCGA